MVGTFIAYSQISQLLGILISIISLCIVILVSLTIENAFKYLDVFRERFKHVRCDKYTLNRTRPFMSPSERKRIGKTIRVRIVYRAMYVSFVILWILIIIVEIYFFSIS